MKKTTKKAKGICAHVSRFGHDPVKVEVPTGSTVEEVLEEAGVDLNGREQVYILGAEADMEDIVEDKDVLSVVTPKAAGSR